MNVTSNKYVLHTHTRRDVMYEQLM